MAKEYLVFRVARVKCTEHLRNALKLYVFLLFKFPLKRYRLAFE